MKSKNQRERRENTGEKRRKRKREKRAGKQKQTQNACVSCSRWLSVHGGWFSRALLLSVLCLALGEFGGAEVGIVVISVLKPLSARYKYTLASEFPT